MDYQAKAKQAIAGITKQFIESKNISEKAAGRSAVDRDEYAVKRISVQAAVEATRAATGKVSEINKIILGIYWEMYMNRDKNGNPLFYSEYEGSTLVEVMRDQLVDSDNAQYAVSLARAADAFFFDMTAWELAQKPAMTKEKTPVSISALLGTKDIIYRLKQYTGLYNALTEEPQKRALIAIIMESVSRKDFEALADGFREKYGFPKKPKAATNDLSFKLKGVISDGSDESTKHITLEGELTPSQIAALLDAFGESIVIE